MGEETMAVYSVWAMPTGKTRDVIKTVMSKLRSEVGGPEFEPHMTVVGATKKLTKSDAVARLESACSAISPYKCKVDRVTWGTFFYQCVFALVHKTPELSGAHVVASRIFGNENAKEEEYMPHISLLYAHLSDSNKENAVENILSQDDKDLVSKIEFHVSSLCLWETETQDESLQSWQKFAEIPLTG